VGPACEQYFVQFPKTPKHKIKDEKKRMQDTKLFEHCSISAIASHGVEGLEKSGIPDMVFDIKDYIILYLP